MMETEVVLKILRSRGSGIVFLESWSWESLSWSRGPEVVILESWSWSRDPEVVALESWS